MKRVIIVLIWAMIVVPGAAVAQKSIQVITEAWPPYIMKNENGQPSGILYDMTQEVLNTMGYTMTFKFYPWKRCLLYMREQKEDALLGVAKDEDFKSYMLFPETDFLPFEYVFFYKKGHEFNYEGIKSLTGKTIGIIEGYTYSPEFNKATNFTKDAVATFEQNIKKLLAGRISLIIGTKDVHLYVAKNMGVLDQLGYSSNPLLPTRLAYLSFSQKAGHEELAQKFSEALTAFKRTDRYTEIYNKYTQ